jgi:hypothetical protein
MELRRIYRIENPIHMDGMWYTKDGIYRKTIDILCPNGKAKEFPMPLDLEHHKKSGFDWQSAGKSVEDMNFWFTSEDALSLYNNGFRLFEFEVTEFQELENEILFHRGGVITQKEIPLDVVWDINLL